MSLIGAEELEPIKKESRIKHKQSLRSDDLKELSKKPEEPKKKTTVTARKSVKTETSQVKRRSKKLNS